LGTVRGLVDIDNAHDGPSTRQPGDKERERDKESVQGHSAASATTHNGKDAVHDSSALRYKGNGCNGDSNGITLNPDRGHSAVFPPRSVLKKSHKKGVSKGVVDMSAGTGTVTGSATEVRFNSHALGIKVGVGAVSREMHVVSKGAGAGGSGGPPYLPSSSSSSSVLHPQPSIASQRQRRTDGAVEGDCCYPILLGCTTLLMHAVWSTCIDFIFTLPSSIHDDMTRYDNQYVSLFNFLILLYQVRWCTLVTRKNNRKRLRKTTVASCVGTEGGSCYATSLAVRECTTR
jgi:hypothetical protein